MREREGVERDAARDRGRGNLVMVQEGRRGEEQSERGREGGRVIEIDRERERGGKERIGGRERERGGRNKERRERERARE